MIDQEKQAEVQRREQAQTTLKQQVGEYAYSYIREHCNPTEITARVLAQMDKGVEEGQLDLGQIFEGTGLLQDIGKLVALKDRSRTEVTLLSRLHTEREATNGKLNSSFCVGCPPKGNNFANRAEATKGTGFRRGTGGGAG